MRTDIYTIKFFIKPPDSTSLGYHYDWNQEVGSLISKVEVFEYSNLDLETISNAFDIVSKSRFEYSKTSTLEIKEPTS